MKLDSFCGTTISGHNGAVIKICERAPGYGKYIAECSKCSPDVRLWPYGSIIVQRHNVICGKFTCGCSKRPLWTQEQQRVRAARMAKRVNAEFVEWASEWAGAKTKCVLRCPEHGVWQTSDLNKLQQGRGCPDCGAVRTAQYHRLPVVVRAAQMRETAKLRGLTFIGFSSAQVTAKSKASFLCPKHGKVLIEVHRAAHEKLGCPRCAKSGFSTQDDGWLYLLQSECAAFMKIGITKRRATRFARLRKETPFGFIVLRTVFLQAGKVSQAERAALRMYESAGLSGFSGATEWLRADPDIVRYVSSLG